MSEDNGMHHDPDISALYRRSSAEQPGAELDAAVLATARRQVMRRRHRRLLSYSSAAMVVLGLTVTFSLIDQDTYMSPPQEYAVDSPAMSAPSSEADLDYEAPPSSPVVVPAPAKKLMPRMRDFPKRTAPATRRAPVPSIATDSTPPEAATDVLAPAMQPEQWLAHIETLLGQGEEGKARAQLDAFVLRYPDYLLPLSLQTLRESEGAE